MTSRAVDSGVGGLISVGVDWVTATTHEQNKVDALAHDWQVWLENCRAVGDEEKPTGKLGYKGFEVQHVFFGVREDGCMLVASGWPADIWAEVVHTYGWHVTRLDVQVTGVVEGADETYSERIAANAVEARADRAGGRPRKVTRIAGYGDGDTVAVGSRHSQQYGRVYDKHAETPSDYPQGAWRYEVEFKAEAAEAALEAVMTAADKEQAVAGLVRGFYERRGLALPWHAGDQIVTIPTARIETGDERSLKWLSANVAPTVARLVKRGKRDDVLKALGLDKP